LKQLRIMAAALQAMTVTDMIIYPEDYAVAAAEPEKE
jgi:hypothetical protein